MTIAAMLRDGGVAAYDLPTADKIPKLRRLLGPTFPGMKAIDIGSGTGFTTLSVLAGCEITCVDSHAPNLDCVANLARVNQRQVPILLKGTATHLPVSSAAFDVVMCSEVLEHLEDDESVVAEISRVLKPQALALITVPYTGYGFTSFLEKAGIKTVHDYPGPEQHIRPGYDEQELAELLHRHGLQIDAIDFYLKWLARCTVDAVGLTHIAYQLLRHRRRVWTWADAAAAENGLTFKVYKFIYPLLRFSSILDDLLFKRARGFAIIVRARKA
ncbi:MAG: class I SAM-dependent methyltransferase [Acidobacteriota bacterium]|nr:class I SAM-dependent methyltransferase [Acidobacteriota bacterium]